jgi:CopG family nickel-responsive transcriptional regulator
MGIISISIPGSLLEKVDSYRREQGFTSRSEVLRQALRDYISESRKLDELQGKITVTITVIYRREAKRGQIADLQHNYGNAILTFLHTHVEEDRCIEIVVARDEAHVIRALVGALKAHKQISEVKVMTL